MPRESFSCSYDAKTKLYRKRIKDVTGKYKSLYDRDKSALRKKYEAARRDVEASLVITDDITVADYASKWYALYTGELSTARKNDYKLAINARILPHIGIMRLRDVRQDDIKKILLGMSLLSYSSQVKTVTTLKLIFSAAVANRLIDRSPCVNIKAGGYKSKTKTPLTAAQSETLINAVAGTSAHTFVLLGLYAGLRREEILGLMWDSVHLGEVPYIEVRRALTFDGTRPVVSDKLKSNRSSADASRRDIPIPALLADHLRELPRVCGFVVHNTLNTEHSFTSYRNMWRMVVRRTMSDNDKILLESDDAEIRNMAGAVFRHPTVKRTIDFNVTPHILRHTYITNLVLSGMNIKKVQYLAGHANINLTLNIYTKLLDNRPDDLYSDVTKAFSG